GEQPVVPAAGHNRRVPVFGGLDARTGVLTLHLAERKRTADFLAFLRLLLQRYAGRHVFLFLDNCAIHNSRAALRFLADHRARITPIWNAPYAPEINLIERYWGHLKAKAIHNDYFRTVESLCTAIRQAARALNRSRTLRLQLTLRTFRRSA
ncbi:MAG: transposase, partial [Planctomycetota bacterium]